MIGIVDYNAGNITSVEHALKSIGADYVLSKNPAENICYLPDYFCAPSGACFCRDINIPLS